MVIYGDQRHEEICLRGSNSYGQRLLYHARYVTGNDCRSDWFSQSKLLFQCSNVFIPTHQFTDSYDFHVLMLG